MVGINNLQNRCIITSKKLVFFLTFMMCGASFAQFVHPGLSHKKSDLERMKYMVEAEIEPFATSYQLLAAHPRAQYDIEVAGGNTGMTVLTAAWNKFLVNDGITAYYNALMWTITGDERHAEKAIEVFTVWSDLTSQEINFALTGGRHWKLIEAAEIMKSTYSGWDPVALQKFKDMLVYPGYSNTTVPTGDHTLYWLIYQGDPARHGNQGIFGMRVMMAMGVFLDNEIMYDRAVRYLKGFPHRTDDLPYLSGPPITNGPSAVYEHFEEYNLTGFETTISDYGYNEVISNYIYENGQCQESSRDQAHAHGGVATLCTMAEIDWNQGGNLYGHLNNRLLLGLSFWYRYNLSWVESFPDQTSPWEPTVENGEYIKRSDRSGRWTALKINPYLAQTTTDDVWHRGRTDLLIGPALESNLGHYKYRMNLPSEDTKWLERGFDFLTNEIGVEQLTTTDYPGLGGLKYRRVSPGDPISGFDSNDLPVYKMNEVSTVIEAENYDYFVLEGEGRTYSDTSSSNSGSDYRTDENVDINVCPEGGYAITGIADGEWLTYTIHVPSNGLYNIDIGYASANGNGKIQFNFGGEEITSEVSVPHGPSNSTGLTDWKDFEVANQFRLTKGVQSMKVLFSGSDNSFELNTIKVSLIQADLEATNLAPEYGVATQSTTAYEGTPERAIDENTNGSYGGNSVTHTNHGAVGSGELKWWQVDLQANYLIETINIHNRTGSTSYSDKLNNFTVEVIDSNGNVSFTQTYEAYPNPLLSIPTGDVTGQVVRISKTSDYAISLAEVEVYGVAATLSNEEFVFENKINIYPNPVLDRFVITNSIGATIKMYNAFGKLIDEIKLDSTSQMIDISHLNSGLYFVEIVNNGTKITRKIIKK